MTERPRAAAETEFFVGSYNEDGWTAFIDERRGGVVARAERGSVEPLNEWPSFNEFIVSETERLATMFDERGRPLDPYAPTTPRDR